jgi:hypothetical protein
MFYAEFIAPRPTPSWRITLCGLSATTYSTHRSCPPCMVAVSWIWNLRIRHAVVTGGPLNMELKANSNNLMILFTYRKLYSIKPTLPKWDYRRRQNSISQSPSPHRSPIHWYRTLLRMVQRGRSLKLTTHLHLVRSLDYVEFLFMSCDSAVGIATGYVLEDWGFGVRVAVG